MAKKRYRNSGRIRYAPAHDPDERYGADAETPEDRPRHRLDSPDSEKLYDKLREWLRQEQEWQADNRADQATDCDYYDSIQTWREEDLPEMEARGQAPLVMNKVKPAIDWMLGTERRTRVDWKILPREDHDEKSAETKTALFKYVSDVTRAPFARSKAFAHAQKAGVGWIEAGVRSDASDDPLFVATESWRNIWYDHNSTDPLLEDARYLFRKKWLDLDVAIALFPEREAMLRECATNRELGAIEDPFDLTNTISQYQRRDGQGRLIGPQHLAFIGGDPVNQREQVSVYECWYRMPKRVKRIRGGDFRNVAYDEKNDDMRAAVNGGIASVYDAVELVIRSAIFCDKGLLYEGPSPYRHKRFPLVPIWAYRRDRDNAPYGPIRPVRDPQDDLNKRFSKAQFLLASNRVIADEDVATEDRWDEIREEVARPDGMVLLNGVARKDGRFEIDRSHQQLAAAHLEVAAMDGKMIEEIAGINSENMGRETNAESGKAILARQNEGGIITTELFDNYRLAVQALGEIMLSLIEQFYSDEKVIRITGESGRVDWLKINQPELDPLTGQWRYLNDITASQADFIVSTQDYRESLRIAMFEQLSDMVAKLPPEVGIKLLDLVMDFADVPGKDEIVRRIRQINGQSDPSKNPNDPEVQAEEQARAESAQRQAALEAAQLKEAEAKADKTRAEAEKVRKEGVKVGTETIYSGMQTAQVIAQVPGVAPVADDVLRSAGWQDPQPPGVDPNLPAMPAPVQNNLPAPSYLPQPMPTPGVGVRAGIETQRADGVRK